MATLSVISDTMSDQAALTSFAQVFSVQCQSTLSIGAFKVCASRIEPGWIFIRRQVLGAVVAALLVHPPSDDPALGLYRAFEQSKICCRSFSFDDLDDMVNGGNRKARGHREDFVSQMAPANPRRQQIGLQGSELDHQRMHAGQRWAYSHAWDLETKIRLLIF